MCKGSASKLPLQLMLQSTIELTQQVLANTERCKSIIPEDEHGLREAFIKAEQAADLLNEQLEQLSRTLSSDQEQEQMRQHVITFLK